MPDLECMRMRIIDVYNFDKNDVTEKKSRIVIFSSPFYKLMKSQSTGCI
jgi:hypothetical protein